MSEISIENKIIEMQVLRKELEDSDEFKKLELLRHFRYSLEVFEWNYSELVGFLERIYDNPLDFSSQRKAGEFGIALRNSMRLLHNMVASASSLIDHARVLVRKVYVTEAAFIGYSEEIKTRFSDNGISQFIVKLRQYSQHYRLPELIGNFHIDSDSMSVSINLKRDLLLEFDSWGSVASNFLKNSPENIEIKALCFEYKNNVLNFYEWFFNQHTIFLHKEIELVNTYAKKIAHYASPMVNNLLRISINHFHENPESDPKNIFMPVLGGDDWLELEKFDLDLKTWFLNALEKFSSSLELEGDVIASLHEIFLSE